MKPTYTPSTMTLYVGVDGQVSCALPKDLSWCPGRVSLQLYCEAEPVGKQYIIIIVLVSCHRGYILLRLRSRLLSGGV